MRRQATIDFGIERIAVYGSGRLVMIAWVGHPLGGAHDVAEAFPDFGAEHRNIHIAIAGLIYARGDDGGGEIARLRGDFAVDTEARRWEVLQLAIGLKQGRKNERE